jgi:predicted enzyme related to lactoylglutathione lyase
MQLLLNIDVSDLARAIEFYRSALGLHHARSLFDDSVAEMLGAGCRIYLIKRETAEPATGSGDVLRSYDRHWTPIHPDFIVDDIDHALAQAVAAGAIAETPVRTFDWGKLVTLSDPFGNGFCLIDFPGEPYAI